MATVNPQVSAWVPVLALAAIVISVMLAIGYGVIGFALLFVVVSMGGGAFLYWIDGD